MMRNFTICFIALLFSMIAHSGEHPSISVSEAKTFLEEKMRESFPGHEIVIRESNIAIKKLEDIQSICYSNECWPVKKNGDDLIDLAAKAAATLQSVRVEFRYTYSDTNDPKIKHIGRPSFAVEIGNIVYISDVLRFLNGYRQFSPYHLKFAPKEDVSAKEDWVKADFFSNGNWLESREVVVQYANIGYLEEIYDGEPNRLLSLTASELRKHPFFKGGFVILSPWAIFPTSIVKDGIEKVNLADKQILPTGPLKGQWIYDKN